MIEKQQHGNQQINHIIAEKIKKTLQTLRNGRDKTERKENCLYSL